MDGRADKRGERQQRGEGVAKRREGGRKEGRGEGRKRE